MSVTGVMTDASLSIERSLTRTADLEAAFDACCASLYRYAVVRLGDRDTADDMMQQLWLQAVRGAAHVPPDELEYWLRGVLRNLIRTHWRRQRVRPPQATLADPNVASQVAAELESGELPDALLHRQEVHEQLLLALTELRCDEQELIIRHYFRQESQAELAAALHVSVRAIEGRLYRARQALRSRLRRPE